MVIESFQQPKKIRGMEMNNQPERRVDQVSRVIKASLDKVYEAILNGESLATWLPPEGMTGHVDRYEPWEGGAFQITLTYLDDQYAEAGKTSENKDVTRGVLRQLIPNQLIVWESSFASEEAALREPMLMSWQLDKVTSDSTKVSITAENVPEAIKKQDHLDGLTSTLENLEAYLTK